MMYWRALNAEEGLAHMPVSCVRPLASQQQKKKKIKARSEIACAMPCDGSESLLWGLASKWLISCQGRYLLLILREFMHVHERDVFVYSFSLLCLSKLQSHAYVYTDSSVSLHPNCQTVCLTETHTHVESARWLAVHQTVRLSLY